jgi:hypothetical protein
VRNRHRSPPPRRRLQRLLHYLLTLRVQRARRLIQQQDRGVTHQGARDGDALALAAGEGESPRSGVRVVAFREGGDEVMDVGGLAGLDERLFGYGACSVGNAQEDVLSH